MAGIALLSRLPGLPRLRRPRWRKVAGRRSRRRQGGGLFNLTRLAGALLMLAASAALNWLTATDHFRLEPASVTVEGLHYTPADDAEEALALDPTAPPNLFRLRTQAIARALEALPAVAHADVRSVLPDTLAVRVTERVPVLVWEAGGAQVLVDVEGTVISAASGTTDLPLALDRRAGARVPPLGGRLDSIDLAAVLRIGALTPERIDSRAEALRLEVDPVDGFVLYAQSPDWRAVFGPYTPNLRPPTIIDGQVQCLRSLLAQGEEQVEVIYLSPSEERCGTFRPRPTPRARISQNVAGTQS